MVRWHVGLGAEDPGLQGLVHKVGVINEGQWVDVYNIVLIFRQNEIRNLNLYGTYGRFSPLKKGKKDDIEWCQIFNLGVTKKVLLG